MTDDLARESGFGSAAALLSMAKHGREEHVYLIRFHYRRHRRAVNPPDADGYRLGFFQLCNK